MDKTVYGFKIGRVFIWDIEKSKSINSTLYLDSWMKEPKRNPKEMVRLRFNTRKELPLEMFNKWEMNKFVDNTVHTFLFDKKEINKEIKRNRFLQLKNGWKSFSDIEKGLMVERL